MSATQDLNVRSPPMCVYLRAECSPNSCSESSSIELTTRFCRARSVISILTSTLGAAPVRLNIHNVWEKDWQWEQMTEWRREAAKKKKKEKEKQREQWGALWHQSEKERGKRTKNKSPDRHKPKGRILMLQYQTFWGHNIHFIIFTECKTKPIFTHLESLRCLFFCFCLCDLGLSCS